MEERIGNEEEGQQLPFNFRKKDTPPGVQQQNWQAVETAIALAEEPVVHLKWLRPTLVAASVLFVTVISVWLLQRTTSQPQMSELKTFYGEMKHITLPDGSQVVLNANSTIRLPKEWKDEGDRQIWLEGEAYFQVSKKPATHQKFIVHTSRVDVEVLGTKFNVNTRRQHAIVSLEEGKVQLTVQGKIVSTIEKKIPPVLQLHPGETAIIDTLGQMIVNENKEVVYHSGWSRNEFHFDNTPLSDVAGLIEDLYGYKMQVSDTSFMTRTVSGDLRAANINELVKVLEVTFKLKMTINDRTIQVSHY